MTLVDFALIFFVICAIDCTSRALARILDLFKRLRYRKTVEARVEQIRVEQEPVV